MGNFNYKFRHLTIGVSFFCACFLTTNTVTAQEKQKESKIKKDTVRSRDLEQVVVTALGITRAQKKLGYAISKVDAKDINESGVTNPMAALQGKVPGVFVNVGSGGPQSSSRILIRGNTSLGPNNQPLIVVDGVIMDNGTTGADPWGDAYDFGNEMKNLNTEAFESISILRGAAASALYGSRASNGVIVFTSKKGRKGTGIGIKVSSDITTETAYAGPKLQNEYGGGLSTVFSKDSNGNRIIDPQYGGWLSYGPKFDGQPIKDLDGRIIPWSPKKNNFLDLYQTGINRNHVLELSGGTEKSSFIFSYNNNEVTGILPNNKFEKNAFYFRATHEFSKFLKMDASINYVKTYSANPVPQGGNGSPLFWFLYSLPRQFDTDYWKNNYLDPINGGIRRNTADPYSITSQLFNIYQNNREQNENNYIGRVELRSEVTKWLNLTFSANFNNLDVVNEAKILGSDPKFAGGKYSIAQGKKQQYNFKFLADAHFDLTKDLTLAAFLGAEEWRSKYKEITNVTDGGLRIPGVFELYNSVNPGKIYTNYTDGYMSPKIIRSVYAFANLAWKNQLFLDITGRNDWSSTLAYPNRTGKTNYFYPSFTGAWIFSDTFKTSKWLSFGKLRVALAWTGRDTSPYNTSSGLFYNYGDNYVSPNGSNIPLVGFNSRNLANLNLKNELTRSIELGLNLAFLKNRIELDATVYQNNTTNQILSLATPVESGVASQQINAGEIRNRGIELALSGKPIYNDRFKWNSTITFSKNVDKVLSLAPGVQEFNLEGAMGTDVRSVAIPGQEYGIIMTKYGYARYQALDANGNKINDPKNGMPVLNSSGFYVRSDSYQNQGYVRVGKIAPDFLSSFRNTFTYKNLSLDVLIDARVGGDFLSATYNYGVQSGVLASTLYGRDPNNGGIAFKDASGVDRVGVIPNGVFGQNTVIKDLNGVQRNVGGMTYQEVYNNGWIRPVRTELYYYYSASWGTGIREQAVLKDTWVALRQVQLTYSFPKSLLAHTGLTSLRASLVARNLFYIYNELPSNINPDGLYNNRSGSAFEYGGAPFTRYVGFHIDFTL